MGVRGKERGYESDTRTSITKTLKENIYTYCSIKLCQFKGEFYLTEDAEWPKNAENVQIFSFAGFIWLLYQ